MNILHISRTMGQGGAEKIVYQLCKDNKKDHLIVASTGGVYVGKLMECGVQNKYIPDIDNKSPYEMIKTFFLLNSIVHKEKIDIIHTHHRMAAFYVRMLQVFNKKIKHVYTAHNVFYGRRWLLRFALQKANIIAVGNGVKDNLHNEYGVPRNKIRIIYNAVDTEYDKSYKNPTLQDLKQRKKIVVGSIGRLCEQKGMDILLKATALIKDELPEVSIVIVGDGELKKELLGLAHALEIEDIAYFLGYQSNVLALINEMDFVVLSSRWEGLPLTPIEVFSQSKTIIATNIPGNNEIVTVENGILFKKDFVEELAEKIKILCNDADLRHKLESNAYNSYSEKYSYTTFLDAYNRIYHEYQ